MLVLIKPYTEEFHSNLLEKPGYLFLHELILIYLINWLVLLKELYLCEHSESHTDSSSQIFLLVFYHQNSKLQFPFLDFY